MLNYDNDIVFKTLMLKGDTGAQGTSIVSIEKTSTVGLVDTYTITLNDGTEYEFTVTNGRDSYYDSDFSTESENAVQNKVITAAINTITATLVSIQEYDAALSATSENAVQNKVIKDAIDSINTALETIQQYDSALSSSSENAVQNKVVKAAIDLKADSSALTDYYTKSEVDSAFNNLGASSIPYNNTSSGLAATDTQAALDEIANLTSYSTTEKVIGKWIDNSALYRKVYTDLNISTTPNTWTETGLSKGSINRIINARAFDSYGQSFACAVGFNASTIIINIPLTRQITGLIFEYTKS